MRISVCSVTSHNTLTASYERGRPLVMFALLEHEQRMSVCNYLLQRSTAATTTAAASAASAAVIKSKETLLFHVGYRRFEASAIFSQHTNGNKHQVRLKGCPPPPPDSLPSPQPPPTTPHHTTHTNTQKGKLEARW